MSKGPDSSVPVVASKTHTRSKPPLPRIPPTTHSLEPSGEKQMCWTQSTSGTDMGATTPQRCDLTAFLSTDDGNTWSGGLLLDERTAVSYPDIAQSPDGDIYVHYDRNRAVDAEILFARFREEDVLAQTLKSTIKNSNGMRRGAD